MKSVVWCVLVGLAACQSSPPPVCPECPQSPPQQPCPVAATCESEVVADSRRAQLALAAAHDLLAERYGAVRALLEPKLFAELDESRLAQIVKGVRGVHTGRARIMDAWETTISEEGERLPAAAASIRWAGSTTRFRLLLVFNPDETVRGLWLKPF